MSVTLDDGLAVFLRPITASDRPLIAEGIRNLSDESRHLRFFSWFKEAPDALLNALADADGCTHIAWGALDVSGDTHRPIAAVHAYRRDRSDPRVELACAVADPYQGRGLSQILMAVVLTACHRLGIERAIAEVLPSNRAAQHLFLGLDARLTGREEVLRLEMDVAASLAALAGPERPAAVAPLLADLARMG